MAVNLRLDWCSYKAAKYAVENWHYSKRMPKFKQVYIGVWENNIFIGCVIFGLSVTPHLGDKYGFSNIECAELTRIALTTHKSSVSKIISIAINMIKRQSPGLKLIISYADPVHNHTGGVYQASNWVYVGNSASVRSYFWRGRWRNDSPMLRYFKNNKKEKENIQSKLLPPKYKYLYPLNTETRKQIEPLRKPYPKRQKDSSEPSAIHAEEGGAAPTLTLHNSPPEGTPE